MTLDLEQFYAACNPAESIKMKNPEERRYYIDFATVRGAKVIKSLKRVISRLSPNKPTCQLFTGHIGCGKSTELSRLQTELEDEGFHVVYFEAKEDLDYDDVDVSDILLAIAHQVSASLQQSKIKLSTAGLQGFVNELWDVLQTPVEFSEAEVSLPVGLAKITAKAKASQPARSKLRQFMEPQTKRILKLVNEEIIHVAQEQLKQRGQKGLAVIIDALDRIPYSNNLYSNKPLPEYIFVEKGEQLRKIDCHLVYTLPMGLIYSNKCGDMEQRLGGGLKTQVLPMVPTRSRDGQEFAEGMELLRQMVLSRAFPELSPQERSGLITEVFDSKATLDRLCRISGGHSRNLLGMLYGCLQQEDPPIPADTLESVIQGYRDSLLLKIDDQEWELLFQVDREQTVKGEKEAQILLPSLFVFEYHDKQGTWFGVNPLLLETKKYRQWQADNK